jgi:hypothetical protein
MEIRLEINSDIEFGLNRLVEQHGRNREYYLAQLVQTGIRNLETTYRAESNLDSRDVMSRYALED